MPPLGRPLYEHTRDTRLAIARHDIEGLKRRGAGRWIYVGTYPDDPDTTSDSPPFQNGWVNSGDGTLAADQLTRFRWLLGGGTEIHINATGGTTGTIIFTLPNLYWDAAKQTFPAVDDTGAFISFTVVPRNDGSGEADVFAGRV
jgi:hypothetical protein